MELYFCIFVILSLLSLVEIFKIGKIEQKYTIVVLSSVCLFLGAIRYNTGTDWGAYYAYFTQGYSYDYFMSDHNFEFGYKLLNYLVKCCVDEYGFLLALISGICIYCYYKCSAQLTIYPITFALVMFSADFYGVFPVRTTIATALALLSYCMIKRQNVIGFIFTVIIGLGFHRVAIIILPAYWLYNNKICSGKMLFIMLFCIGVGCSNILLEVADCLQDLDSIYLAKLSYYIKKAQSGYQFGATVDKDQLAQYMIVFKVAFIAFILSFRREFEERIANFSGLFNLFFWGNCLYFLLVFISVDVASRLTGLYVVTQYLLMVNMIGISNKMKYRVLIWMLIVGTSFLRLNFKFINTPDAYIPYNSIWW